MPPAAPKRWTNTPKTSAPIQWPNTRSRGNWRHCWNCQPRTRNFSTQLKKKTGQEKNNNRVDAIWKIGQKNVWKKLLMHLLLNNIGVTFLSELCDHIIVLETFWAALVHTETWEVKTACLILLESDARGISHKRTLASCYRQKGINPFWRCHNKYVRKAVFWY